jgi:hypothetical protein
MVGSTSAPLRPQCTSRRSPRSAGIAQWQSMQNKDLGAIERVRLEDYLSAGGSGSEARDGKDEKESICDGED